MTYQGALSNPILARIGVSLIGQGPVPITQMDLISDLTLQRGIGPATFTRSTIGTFDDVSTELVTTAAIDAARFETNGVLIEGASTNEALHNRDFTNVVHVKTNITALKDAVGADGVNNSSSTLTATAGNGTVFQTVTKASAENTYSIDIRRKTGTGTIEITDDGGGSFTDVTSSINSSTYTRFQITTTQVTPSFGVRIVTSGDEIEVDYEQLEALPFALSRIETTTSAVTRAVDSLTLDSSSNFNETQGTITLDVTLIGENSVQQFVIQIDDGTASNRYALLRDTTDKLRTFISDGNVIQADYSESGTWPASSRSLTLAYIENSIETFVNGVSVGSDSLATLPTSLTTIRLGVQLSNSSPLNGHIKNFKIYEVANL